ncbi:MAG: cytidylyltransferase domain-containing protein [Pyrinomonadaceae bacterium]
MGGVLGLIPARGGSKSIPKKNIALLAGRPLLAYTCEAALASKRVTRVVLSTDDGDIANVGKNCGVEVPFLRPKDLSQDDTPSIAVVEHCLRWLAENNAFEPDIVVLLQPTSPLRRAHHIDEALAHLEAVEAETVVSVINVPHRFSPYSIMKLDKGWLHDFWEQPVPFDRYRRQEVPRLYARNGPAILAARAEVIREYKSFYGSRVTAYLMGDMESIDIDDPFDLELAAWLIERQTELNH